MLSQDPEPLRRSIEVEYWVVDTTGRLADPTPLLGAAPGVEREFVEPVLEIKTTPCETTRELREELFDRLRAVLERAESHDLKLVPLATPIGDAEIRDLPSDRTRVQTRVVGDRFEYVRHCAGTHIHVEQQPGREIDQVNTLIALDPALALANSIPYFRGEYEAAGARSKLYRREAYADLAHQGRLWRYMDDTTEWQRRLERRYEEFEQAAMDAGFDRSTIVSNFDPESAVWTPVQLRERFPTVEWRSPDTTLPSQCVQLVDDLATIVGRLGDVDLCIQGDTGGVTDETMYLPTFETVLEHVDAAIEDGLDSASVRSYLDRMGFTVDAYDPLTTEFDGMGPISRREAREIRLEYADRLETDVRQPKSLNAD